MIEMQSSEFDNEKPATLNKQVSAVISYLNICIIFIDIFYQDVSIISRCIYSYIFTIILIHIIID